MAARSSPAAPSAEMSMARQTREVSGMRCCFVASWAEVMRSHSRARAAARCGFEAGMWTICLVAGWRRGRSSRKTWRWPAYCQHPFRRGSHPSHPLRGT